MNLDQPIFSERHRSSLLTRTLSIIGWVIMALAIFVGGSNADAWWPDSLILLALGAVLVASHWFLAPRHYDIYDERLVITYGRPRKRTIPFDEISELQVVSHPLGTEIRIKRTRRWSLTIQPWQPKQYHARLEAAFNRFQAVKWRDQPTEPSPGNAQEI